MMTTMSLSNSSSMNNNNNNILFSKAGLKRPRSTTMAVAPQQPQQQQQQPRRKVCFSSEPPLQCRVPHREEQTSSDIWYTEEEYTRFKSDAKQSAHVAKAQLEGATLKSVDELDSHVVASVVPRGVEHRISLARSKRKYMAIRAVLDTQKRMQREMVTQRLQGLAAAAGQPVTPEVVAQAHCRPNTILQCLPPSRQEVVANGQRLANIAMKFNKWATRHAVVTAARDAREARQGEPQQQQQQQQLPQPRVTTATMSSKRKQSQQAEQEEEYASDSEDSVGPGGINVKRRRISATRHNTNTSVLLEACCDVTLLEPIPVF